MDAAEPPRTQVHLLSEPGCPRARLLSLYLTAYGVEPHTSEAAPGGPAPAALSDAFSVVPSLPAVVVCCGKTTLTLSDPTVTDVHRTLSITPLRHRSS